MGTWAHIFKNSTHGKNISHPISFYVVKKQGAENVYIKE